MRDLFERSRFARVTVVVVAGCCVLALVQAAAARNDLDMRDVFRAPMPTVEPAPALQSIARKIASRHSSTARPLRIALQNPPRQEWHGAERRKPVPSTFAARRPPLVVHLVALPPTRDELFEPVPEKPAIISIYEDQTLRRGDAVMMRDGLHIFRGLATGTHRAVDFVQLTRAASLDWHLRKTLSAFEYNPPDRWRT